MTAMRIAYICADPGVPVFGTKGCSIHVQEIVRAFGRLGHKVTLFARRRGGDAPADLADIRCVDLAKPDASAGSARELQLIQLDADIAALLDAHGPFDLLYERYALWSSAAVKWAQRNNVPSVLEVNAPLVEEQATHRELAHRELAEMLSSETFHLANRIVAVSTGVARWLVREAVESAKIDVLANGVDAARFTPEYHPHNAEPVIGFVGTLKPWHGLDILVDAAAQLKAQDLPFRLLLVGDGPERATVERALADRGLTNRTELTGAVAPAEIPALLARMDIAVAPYPDLADFYFSPLKVMEYMAAGRAVVASRIGDIDGLIRHDETGLLCAAGDRDALAQALGGLIRSPQSRSRLGSAARHHALTELGWDSVARRILERSAEAVAC
jgi:glycosyltransferase involved in cell wall biosynthesis